MWTFHRLPRQLSVALCFLLAGAAGSQAEDQYIINQNQTGVTLPGVTMPNGFDEVRAADGTTCRASMSGSGAYLDSGVIGGANDNVSAYGRLVVPLGERPTRLNCDRLYQLEIERLELEVQLMRQGLDPRMSSRSSGSWASDASWTNKGRR
ncbi:hypothetical protein R2G56_01190 [Nitratireductor aquimarinus]|uniref:Uncharacterized protein n=1 Tax=Nitratireductor aquimarinus TaxID=889300 RepID=A0ABU4AF70_9HYPH|nr:hypothetical protein [Nitratireductor aquimarinus]MDV6224888.1 hypothetical protein [Nitratireductor aquimarinus]